ncbi:MAG TPA: hypothetical protein PK987_13210, partial [Ferruginibacter sp.]|nr:hypothetical protein [Ferruginibacter sp.]
IVGQATNNGLSPWFLSSRTISFATFAQVLTLTNPMERQPTTTKLSTTAKNTPQNFINTKIYHYFTSYKYPL